MSAIGFTREGVGKVHFNKRDAQCAAGVKDGNGSMAITAGIQDYSRCSLARFLDPIDELPLAVSLSKDNIAALLARLGAHCLFYVGQRFMTVDLRLPLADQIEIGSVQHIYRTRLLLMV